MIYIFVVKPSEMIVTWVTFDPTNFSTVEYGMKVEDWTEEQKDIALCLKTEDLRNAYFILIE